ncbi:MAG: DoxX family protein, partial [Hymenobacteraceae bacterium]|nr:DoxX family protein [Hymenobacteraceae bacterium]MDX5397461.1 DoxX family protein [Hymenobacteraceae bacterium]MDX5513539.1 DoxX family protein [Hymenobacteraceae bacterium]
FNKVTDCGCFGDAIKLTPWQSFSKDVILVVLIVILMLTRRYLPPLTKKETGSVVVAITAALSVGIGLYAFYHLPFIDFRAYKEGNNIPTLMKPSAPLRYKYIMEKDGNREEFEEYPTDTTYKFKEMIPINPEDGPKITDFNVWNDEGDYTQEVFNGNKLLIIVHDVHKADEDNFDRINELIHKAEAGNLQIQPMVLTSSSSQDFDIFRHEVNLAAPYYFADATVLKTMIRSNPGVMLLKNGTVVGKWSHNDTPKFEEVKELL